MNKADRMAQIKPLLEGSASFLEIGEVLGVSRELVRQYAAFLGVRGRQRQYVKRVINPRKTLLDGRPLCPHCNGVICRVGKGKLGDMRYRCKSCKRYTFHGERQRKSKMLEPGYYSRIGSYGCSVRWHGSSPGVQGSGWAVQHLFYPFSTPGFSQDDLVVGVNKVVRKSLPESIRADVCQEIICAVLDGRLRQEELSEATVEPFIKKEFREMGWFVSLDAMREDGKKSYGQTLGIC